MMDQEVVDAKSKEHDHLIRNNIYTEVPLNEQKVISTRWVFTEKIVEGKKSIKARLVARGFEEDSDSLGSQNRFPNMHTPFSKICNDDSSHIRMEHQVNLCGFCLSSRKPT